MLMDWNVSQNVSKRGYVYESLDNMTEFLTELYVATEYFS